MKSIVLYCFLIFANLTVALGQSSDAYAKKILDQVSKKYDGYKTIIAEFSFQANQAEGETYADKGRLKLDKASEKFSIKLSSQEIVSDGKSTWTIMPEEKEVQITEGTADDEQIGPRNIFTFYKQGYNFISMDDEKVNGQVLNVIELSPIDKEAAYFKIKLRINPNFHIHDMTVFDKGGAKYTYTINKLYVNTPLPSSDFAYNKNKYPGYEVVDLR